MTVQGTHPANPKILAGIYPEGAPIHKDPSPKGDNQIVTVGSPWN